MKFRHILLVCAFPPPSPQVFMLSIAMQVTDTDPLFFFIVQTMRIV